MHPRLSANVTMAWNTPKKMQAIAFSCRADACRAGREGAKQPGPMRAKVEGEDPAHNQRRMRRDLRAAVMFCCHLVATYQLTIHFVDKRPNSAFFSTIGRRERGSCCSPSYIF